MITYTASIETTNKGTFDYGFHLGTDLAQARKCAEDLIKLRWNARLGDFTVRTVGLKLGNQLVDVFDGDWMSDILYDLDERNFDDCEVL